MAKFPSVAWFDAVRRVYNADDAYRGAGGGQCNCLMGLKVGRERYLVTFEGEAVTGSWQCSNSELLDADFYLEMPLSVWREMLNNIAENGRATLNYTLNTLDLDREEGLSTSVHGDQYREDLFFRYNQTLQFFFNASARVKTVY